ncbi:MAG: hypothetical protein R2797_07275 [Gelidibacter sp.]
MKHFIIIASLLMSAITSAQTNFEKGMQKAFDLWGDNKWTEAEQMFERIAAAEPTEWLPNYYIAQMNSLKTWPEKDPEKVKAQLDKAQEYLNIAMGLEKDNADLLVMQAQILTNWVAFDGMTYGMKYSAKINELYNKAYKLAPENPMVVLGRAEWNMGSAKYFGQDTKPYCNEVEKAIELFANFKPKTPFHPNWGKEHAVEVLASCKE